MTASRGDGEVETSNRASFQNKLGARQVEVLYHQLPVAVYTSLVASAIYAVIVWNVADRPALIVWISLNVVIGLARWLLGRAYARSSTKLTSQTSWRNLAATSMFFSGLVWGLGLIAVAPVGIDFEYHMFGLLWIVGLCAGSMGAYAILPTAYLAFAAPMVVPYSTYLFSTGHRADLFGGIALAMFFGFLWFCAIRLHKALLQSLRLEFENERLVTDLNVEKEAIEELNVTLEDRIAYRTLELVEANQRLRSEFTEREQAQQALGKSEERYRSLYHHTPSMFFTLDANGTILQLNQFGARKLGYEVDDLIGKPFPTTGELSRDGELTAELEQALLQPGHPRRWECGLCRHDGMQLWVSASAQVDVNHESARALLVVCEDITKTRELADTLAYHAAHDGLTGLVNRREFEYRLTHAAQEAREGSASHALLYMDLDLFKIVNDTCGHNAGDDLLRELAGVLGGELGRDDTLARLGGDEFGVLLRNCAAEDAVNVAERLRRATETMRFSWEDQVLRVGMSIGVVPLDANCEDVATLLKCADTACYISKEHGRNRVHMYDRSDEALSARTVQMRWLTRINEALDNDNLRLDFQSIVPLDQSTRTKLRYEILVRMVEDSGEIISAGEFLPAAERYGLVPQIDRWVVSNTLDWLSRQEAEQDRLDFCSINLSGHSLADDTFRGFVIEEFARTGIPGNKVVFEITETAAISQLNAAIRFFEALGALGCRFALDDFGTGFSSFAYLKNLPVDFLKIDGIFVRDITSDPVDLAMVKSINDMGHALGIGTIAECVENEATMAKLRDIGVDHAQGFFIDLPRALEPSLQPAHRQRAS